MNPHIYKALRRYFIAGLLVWLPIFVTYFVARFIIELLDKSLALLPKNYQPEQLVGFHIPGLGLLFTIIILLLTGLLITSFIGHRIVLAWEKLISTIPLLRTVHSAAKQVVHAVVQPGGAAFRRVLLIEFPRAGIWSLAFQTSSGYLENDWSDKTMLTVFVPTTPNPTSGFLMFIPVDQAIELDISVEEALRMIISIGVVVPSHLQKKL